MGNRRRKDRAEKRRQVEALLRRILRWTAKATAVVAVLATLGWGGWQLHRFATTSPYFALESIEIRGNVRAATHEIERLLGVVKGDNIFLAELEEGEAQILEHPWIREVRVRRSFPQALEIEVLERDAVALVDLGHLYLVDGDGELFKRAMPGDPMDLPVITGLSRETWIERPIEAREQIENVLGVLDIYAGSSVSSRTGLAGVHWAHLEGFTLYLGERGPAVRLGSDELAQKLSRLERVLAFAEARGEQLEWIGLDNRIRPGRVAVRKAPVDEAKDERLAQQARSLRQAEEKEQRRGTG